MLSTLYDQQEEKQAMAALKEKQALRRAAVQARGEAKAAKIAANELAAASSDSPSSSATKKQKN